MLKRRRKTTDHDQTILNSYGWLVHSLATVLPCQLGYAEIGTLLACEGRGGANSNHAEWIRTYSSQEFIAGAEKLGCLLDDLTAGWPARAGTPGGTFSYKQPLRISVLGNGVDPVLLGALHIAEQTKVFTAYVRTKAGKITVCAMPRKWRDVEETAAKMSKVPDVERVSVAAYGRIIASFKGGVRIDLEAP